MQMLTGKINAAGYARGETPEMFRKVGLDTLLYVVENARSPVRRALAKAEIARRQQEAR